VIDASSHLQRLHRIVLSEPFYFSSADGASPGWAILHPLDELEW
jgi:hypothetical protein